MQSNVCWLKAKFLNGKADSKLLCAMDGVEIRALEDQSERVNHAATLSSMAAAEYLRKLMTQRSEFNCGQEICQKLSGTNTKQPTLRSRAGALRLVKRATGAPT